MGHSLSLLFEHHSELVPPQIQARGRVWVRAARTTYLVRSVFNHHFFSSSFFKSCLSEKLSQRGLAHQISFVELKECRENTARKEKSLGNRAVYSRASLL